VIGWRNLSVLGGTLRSTFGYVDGKAPQDTAFHAALEAELARMNSFLGLANASANGQSARENGTGVS
jgi:hypothetical protein